MKRRYPYLLALGWIPTLILMGSLTFVEAQPRAQRERTPIQITRIFTGDDGQTHAEEYEVALQRRGQSATELAEAIPVTSVQFRRTSSEYYLDFHNAPRRQFVITLAGESEVELGDGSKIRLHPGHILLAEDLDGQGHISRAIGTDDRISLFLPLAER
ncbi:MAG: hypothetical protein VYE73_00155 [Acidobacteriota bacterium]|nr:hypothetical protein [Acidobacteriota bacterium]